LRARLLAIAGGRGDVAECSSDRGDFLELGRDGKSSEQCKLGRRGDAVLWARTGRLPSGIGVAFVYWSDGTMPNHVYEVGDLLQSGDGTRDGTGQLGLGAIQ